MPNNDYDMDKKIEISTDEMCKVISAKIFCDEINKGAEGNAD